MMTNCFEIPTFFDADLHRLGIKNYVTVDLSRTCHFALVGRTGSGKTTAGKLLLGRFASLQGARAWVLDYKADDFKFCRGCAHHHEYEQCVAGLEDFYGNVFEPRLKGLDPCQDFRILLIEEYGSLISSLDKQAAQRVKTLVGNLLRLSRAFRISVICSSQRMDASFYDAGARENFTVRIGLSTLSNESKTMLFDDYKDDMQPVNGCGRGYMLIDGAGLFPIVVPTVQNANRLETLIRGLVE